MQDNENINIIIKKFFLEVYDLVGNQIKIINDSDINTYSIETYYDNISSKIYIITGNKNIVNSYDYYENKIYKKFEDNDINNKYFLYFYSIVVNERKGLIELIASCEDGNLRIWNFASGLLIKKIKVSDYKIISICLYNNEYILVGTLDYAIKLIQINNFEIIKELKNDESIISIKRINHPKYGESFISEDTDGNIKIWTSSFILY